MERTNRTKDGPVAESGTVTVACKLPNGLIMQLFRMEDTNEPIMGGGQKVVKKAVQDVSKFAPITLNKARLPFGELPEYKIIGGYSLTENVPAEFWNEWLRQNADSDLVKRKLIFAYEKDSRVVDQARELRTNRSGMEPIAQDKDPRMPKDIRIHDKTDKDLQPA